MASVDGLQERLTGYTEKLGKLNALLASDPHNESFLSLRTRLLSAIADVEAAISAASRAAPAPAQRPAPSAAAAAPVPTGSGASAAPALRPAVISAPALTRAPLSGSSAVLHSSEGASAGAAGGGGAGAGGAPAARPAFRLVVPTAGAKRAREEAPGGGGAGEAATGAAAAGEEGEEGEGAKGQYADLHIPDNLKMQLTDVRGAAMCAPGREWCRNVRRCPG